LFDLFLPFGLSVCAPSSKETDEKNKNNVKSEQQMLKQIENADERSSSYVALVSHRFLSFHRFTLSSGGR
jgi:hypothetical protein